jgi:hypothetical protein
MPCSTSSSFLIWGRLQLTMWHCHIMCHFWQHEVALTVQPPATNGQRSGHASQWECSDFVMQFLYMVRVGIAVQHFAASGLRGMYLWLIPHLSIKRNTSPFLYQCWKWAMGAWHTIVVYHSDFTLHIFSISTRYLVRKLHNLHLFFMYIWAICAVPHVHEAII